MGVFAKQNFPYKCFVCGKGHRHRGKNKYQELCKSCATKFMLKGRFLKFKLTCFGALNCREDYDCPLYKHCREVRFFESRKVPQEVCSIVLKHVNGNKTVSTWNKRVKK